MVTTDGIAENRKDGQKFWDVVPVPKHKNAERLNYQLRGTDKSRYLSAVTKE